MAKDDGGPAFPGTALEQLSDGVITQDITQRGMTLRDYMAAAALPSFIGRPDAAKLAYAIADAMLAERGKE